MATYKKKGFKPKDNKSQQSIDMQSTTAEVFNTLDDTASKSEQWIEKNSKPLFYGLVIVIVLILGFLGYNKYVIEPQETAASNELSFPRKHFNEANTAAGSDIDSLLQLGLDGVDNKFGFLDISTQYNGTKAANIANYYAGVSYLKMKEYQKAIEYLSKFNSDDELLGPTALGAIGDAFADIDQAEDALDYYEKAANKKDNEFTTPLFLFKAGRTAMDLGQFSKAEKMFAKIKENYPSTDSGKDIDKYINSAKYAQ
ncbi:MAG: tetratricopeptide repeat protein [Flavobacteriaceae bacterium]|jgi:tetratricopeptide (TPR) repeat protein|tara:strand:- start:185 stop:952 length:768 start_codon:yes stop_codon:yes gene_type:complete